MYNIKTNSHRDRSRNPRFCPPSINSMAVFFLGDKIWKMKFVEFIALPTSLMAKD